MAEDTVLERPGDLVKKLMESKGWSQSELAFVLGVQPATVNQVVNSKRPITPEMAKLLNVAFDVPAERFAELQALWSLKDAPEPSAEVRERVQAQGKFPVREMIKRGWIDASKGSDTHAALCRFFGVNSLDDVARLSHAAKRTESTEIPGSQLAWLYRVRSIAKEMPTPPYSKTALENAVEKMKPLRGSPEETRHVARLLHEAGVRFVVVESLPGGKIDGVCFWLDDTSPVIGMSLRFDRVDNFWFVLAHECAHVLHGHGKSAAIIDADLGAGTSEIDDEEKIANEEASNFCVPREKMRSFYERKYPLFSDIDIQAFAKINRIHPGIVVGQLQHMSGQFKILRQHLVNVRAHVTSSAMVDGWGATVSVG